MRNRELLALSIMLVSQLAPAQHCFAQVVAGNSQVASIGTAGQSVDLDSAYVNARNLLSLENYEDGIKLLTDLANGGYSRAQKLLGDLCRDGTRMPKNYEKAGQWYQKAADLGNVVSQTMIGVLYENGQGVEQNYQTAKEWYQKAAAQGYEPAQRQLQSLLQHK